MKLVDLAKDAPPMPAKKCKLLPCKKLQKKRCLFCNDHVGLRSRLSNIKLKKLQNANTFAIEGEPEPLPDFKKLLNS